jgi:prephenate dehydratase
VKVGYLGPPGTFAEEALLRLVGPEPEQQLVPYPTVIDAIQAVDRGDVPEALVPIENSIEGSVNATLDQLAASEGAVQIHAEIVHPIRHHLVARPGVARGALTRVLSHPHAPPQCTTYLRANLPDIEIVAANSTADAVRIVAEETTESWGAIGTLRAADIYGCEVLAADIEDSRENATRFVLLGRNGVAATGPGRFVTSVICVPPRDRPGGLLSILQEFAMRAINLTRLESRPAKTELGRYVFFIDMEGSRARDLAVDAAIRALEEQAIAHVVFLGSYPAAAVPG